MFKNKHLFSLLAVLVLTVISTGCRKPVDVPEYITVSTSQTAYSVPLEGDSKNQIKLDSAKAFDSLKIMKKRIQISKRWNQTGRYAHEGTWIPTIDVIIVERTPVTKEWTADIKKGTKAKDEAMWVESKDSIEFSTGFNCTSYITEQNASTFLYYYKANSLADVMDEEIRNKIQETLADFAAGHDLDNLRGMKKEMISEVRKQVIPFFKTRGITITTIGMFGGLEYKNPAIQKSIDDVFIAQQLKNVEKAKLSAMSDQKKRMAEEGMAVADKARQVAIGAADAERSKAQAIADAIKMKAEAEANSIEMVTKALVKAQNNVMFLEIKKLEVESQRIAKWKGDVPVTMFGNSKTVVPMLNISK